MFRHVPNALTGARLVLAAVFFAMLGYYQYQGRGGPWLLNIAFLIYLIALITDFFDGYLARLWKVEGAFGRVVDPFVDKVLVIGSFIFFAGKNFIIPDPLSHGVASRYVVYTITGVAPWMVVLILARELLVTSFRALSEGSGQSFGAAFSGKFKMVAQSVTILAILIYVNYLAALTEHGYETYARYFRDFCIWATLLITAFSGLLAVQRTIAMYRKIPPGP
ncbi:MAG TPA: CDP-alcohol phosphatidyltransferase family protein [Tepidisphaeraceae bacterium]|jgi:CDP-diacylglycerol--glycerol-3-phosphate 3-phosphatidyltransferase|nr:CDP-alcohol phosphatidyltransferase family protein [Tepidisphaeraceae bacterium]